MMSIGTIAYNITNKKKSFPILTADVFAVNNEKCKEKIASYKLPVITKIINAIGNDFYEFIECNDIENYLATAVHEGAHLYRIHDPNKEVLINILNLQNDFVLTSELDNYGEPGKILSNIKWPKDHIWVDTYLKGDTSSRYYFSYMLDEMNSYALDAYINLYLIEHNNNFSAPSTLEALLSLMDFVDSYVQTLNENNYLKIKPLVQSLWNNSESFLNELCQYNNLNTYIDGDLGNSEFHLNRIYNSSKKSLIDKWKPNNCFKSK